MKNIGELLKAWEANKKQYIRTVEKGVTTLTAALTSKVRIKVCALPLRNGTIIRYGVSKDGIIEQGRSTRVAKMKLKKQLKYTDK